MKRKKKRKKKKIRATKRIRWIEDDFDLLQSIFTPIKREGYKIDSAKSALDGYEKALNWQKYDLIVVDMIMPISNDTDAPEIVKHWKEDEYVGIGLVKWLLGELKVDRPVVVLSISSSQESLQKSFGDLPIAGYISKRGLLPSTLKELILNLLEP